MVDLGKLAAAIIICELAGGLGAVFTTPNLPTWYAGLQKPQFSPPNWVFFPVWTLLYFLMGLSIYLIWERKRTKETEGGIKMFGLQLFWNILWPYLFFGLQNPLLGLIGIIALWLSIAATIRGFFSIDRNAAYLLIPYILWVSFAALLNFSIWKLNS